MKNLILPLTLIMFSFNAQAIDTVDLLFDYNAKLKTEKQGEERKRITVMPMSEEVVDHLELIKDNFEKKMLNKEIDQWAIRPRNDGSDIVDEVLISCKAKMNVINLNSSRYLGGGRPPVIIHQVFELSCDFKNEVLN